YPHTMFEVKGWKVSAPLKTDTSAPKSRDVSSAANDGSSAPKSKKRKRGTGRSNGPDITADNLGDMYSRHIDAGDKGGEKELGEAAGRAEKKRKTKSKDMDVNVNDGKRKGDSGQSVKDSKKSNGLSGANAQKLGARKPINAQEQQETSSTRKQASHPSQQSPKTAPHTANAPKTVPPPNKLTPLQSRMAAKLTSARFRTLNERLYTSPSTAAQQLFADSPDMFDTYHAGFAQQVVAWPENPVDTYIADILALGQTKGRGDGQGSVLPRNRKGECIIADLGCGTAQLAAALQSRAKKLKLKVHSFDLHAPNSLVTKADIADLPLANGSVDVAVSCLALMGTNWIDFVEEAWRVLRWGGEFWVSEIKSRFARAGGEKRNKDAGNANGGMSKRKAKQAQVGSKKRDAEKEEKENDDVLAVEVDGVDAGGKGDTDVSAFVKVLERRGFVLQGEPDMHNKMFVKMRFLKHGAPAAGKNTEQARSEGKGKKFVDKEDAQTITVEEEAKVLKPCVYKLR
ncbi:hypothetical protein NA57DRAFT_39120, partial [Rhizodiscina lignyota]